MSSKASRGRFAAATAIGCAAAMALGVAGASRACSPVGAPRGMRDEGARPTRGGTLHLATYSDLRGLDPAVAFSTEVSPYQDLLFAGLVNYDGDGVLVPELAERWELSADGRRYTFYLRHGVQMHDGAELTADDVRRSIERALYPDTPCPVAAFYDRIEGFAAYQQRQSDRLAGLEVEGRYTIAIRLGRPDATFLSVLALPALRPVCRSAGSRYTDTFQTHACGVAPFAGLLAAREAARPRRFELIFDALARTRRDRASMDVVVTKRFQRCCAGTRRNSQREWERTGAIYFRTTEWRRSASRCLRQKCTATFQHSDGPVHRCARSSRRCLGCQPAQPHEILRRVGDRHWTHAAARYLRHDPILRAIVQPRARGSWRKPAIRTTQRRAEADIPRRFDTYAARESRPFGTPRFCNTIRADRQSIEIKRDEFRTVRSARRTPQDRAYGVRWLVSRFLGPEQFFEPICQPKRSCLTSRKTSVCTAICARCPP